MRVLKFTLSGKTAFFKKPEVNTYFYFTYGCVHKVALLGIFGAILGYGGYSQMRHQENYPEFYEKLKELKIAIIPKNPCGYIPKKIQSFNNSVGYASYEQGGNLIVKEQWLETPCWEIYVLLDCAAAEQLAAAMQNRTSVYIPYLGKNDHPADIVEVAVVDSMYLTEQPNVIHSLVPKELVEFDLDQEEEELAERPFKYEEALPVSLCPLTNLYQLKTFVYSNLYPVKSSCQMLMVQGQTIVFF